MDPERLLERADALSDENPVAALTCLREACAGAPEDARVRVALAEVLLRTCAFGEAEQECRVARELDPRDAGALAVAGWLAERRGAFEEADRWFSRAARLDPEGHPLVVRLSAARFQEEVDRAAASLPETFRRHLGDVIVAIEPVPPEALLRREDPPMDPRLLGLFEGRALGEAAEGVELPPTIYLFQRNLEHFAVTRDALIEQVRITLFHELGHYLGLDEDQVDALGLG